MSEETTQANSDNETKLAKAKKSGVASQEGRQRIVDDSTPRENTRADMKTLTEAGPGEFRKGLGSDEMVEAHEKGYFGVQVDDIDNEAFTIGGVTSNPEIAAQSGRRDQSDDIALVAGRKMEGSAQGRKSRGGE